MLCLRVFVFLGALLALSACGSGVPQEAVDPYANQGGGGSSEVATSGPAATLDLSSVSLVGDDERSMLATLVADAESRGVVPLGEEDDGPNTYVPRVGGDLPTAVPGSDGTRGLVTPLPRVGVVAGSTPVVAVTATPAPVLDFTYVVPSCEEDFLGTIARDRGLVGRWFEKHFRTINSGLSDVEAVFDADYVRGLNEGFEASRPDCVASGWAPEVSYGIECEGKTLAGNAVTDSSFYGEYTGASTIGRTREGDFVWHPTRQRERLVLIHFLRLPDRDEPGCWTGDMVTGRWVWQIKGGSEFGYMNPSSAVCNGNLLLRAESLYRNGWESSQWMVSVTEYLRANRALCPRHGLYPVMDASEGCRVQVGTGAFQGGVVIHWDTRKVPTGNAVCWVAMEDANDGGLVWSAYARNGDQVLLAVPGG